MEIDLGPAITKHGLYYIAEHNAKQAEATRLGALLGLQLLDNEQYEELRRGIASLLLPRECVDEVVSAALELIFRCEQAGLQDAAYTSATASACIDQLPWNEHVPTPGYPALTCGALRLAPPLEDVEAENIRWSLIVPELASEFWYPEHRIADGYPGGNLIKAGASRGVPLAVANLYLSRLPVEVNPDGRALYPTLGLSRGKAIFEICNGLENLSLAARQTAGSLAINWDKTPGELVRAAADTYGERVTRGGRHSLGRLLSKTRRGRVF